MRLKSHTWNRWYAQGGWNSAFEEAASDSNVRRWYANLKEGSEITADTHLRKLRRFCELHRTTPQALAQQSPKAAYDLPVDNVAELRATGIAGSAIKNYIKTLKSCFTHNDIIITKKVKTSGANKAPTLINETTPEPRVLLGLLGNAGNRSPRSRLQYLLPIMITLNPRAPFNGHSDAAARA